jgi:hypothetical protein
MEPLKNWLYLPGREKRRLAPITPVIDAINNKNRKEKRFISG